MATWAGERADTGSRILWAKILVILLCFSMRSALKIVPKVQMYAKSRASDSGKCPFLVCVTRLKNLLRPLPTRGLKNLFLARRAGLYQTPYMCNKFFNPRYRLYIYIYYIYLLYIYTYIVRQPLKWTRYDVQCLSEHGNVQPSSKTLLVAQHYCFCFLQYWSVCSKRTHCLDTFSNWVCFLQSQFVSHQVLRIITNVKYVLHCV